jgi:hypothetical protein
MTRRDRSRMTMSELIAEAERNDITGAEWMDRAGLVRALEEKTGEGSLGPLARARRLLGAMTGIDRMVKVVRGAIDPTRPEPVVLVTDRERVESAETVAPPPPVVAEPVHEVRVEAPVVELTPDARATSVGAPAPEDLLATEPVPSGMRVVRRDGRAWVVWRAPSARLAAIGRGSDLTLRIVSIDCAIGEPDAQVVVETEEETGVALEGVRVLPESRGKSTVAAIGVGRGADFVAVAHARVA